MMETSADSSERVLVRAMLQMVDDVLGDMRKIEALFAGRNERAIPAVGPSRPVAHRVRRGPTSSPSPERIARAPRISFDGLVKRPRSDADSPSVSRTPRASSPRVDPEIDMAETVKTEPSPGRTPRQAHRRPRISSGFTSTGPDYTSPTSKMGDNVDPDDIKPFENSKLVRVRSRLSLGEKGDENSPSVKRLRADHGSAPREVLGEGSSLDNSQ